MASEETTRGQGEQIAGRIEKLNLDFYRLELEQLLTKGIEVGVFKLSAPEGSTLDSLDESELRTNTHS
jgi:hypothetical protein